MKLVELNNQDKDFYNNFVSSQEAGSFLQSWAWGDWQVFLGRQVKRFKIQNQNEETVGVIQFIKMPLYLNRYYWYCPYGPVLAESGNFKFQISNFQNLIEQKFNTAVFVRIEPKILPLPATSYQLIAKTSNIQPGKTLVIDLTKNEEKLLAEMHHKTRYNIRLAEKHGVKVVDEFHLVNGKGIFAKEAVDQITETSSRQNYKSQGHAYFRQLVDFFTIKKVSGEIKLHIYKALHEDELLATALIIDFGKIRTYLFGGSSDKKKNLMAPYLLHWRIMQDAKKELFEKYDFWGIETSSGKTPGFVRFKSGFSEAPEAVVEYAGAYDVVNKAFEYNIYKALRKIRRIF